MSLAELRDLFIVIFSISGIVAIVFLMVITFLVYRKVRIVLDSWAATVANVRDISSLISENIAKPLANIIGAVQGISRFFEFLSRPVKRREEEVGGWGE
ncbi:MAG: hypothetical protein SVP26_10450 [Chloroflexota bacterium]|nr:hypothetical protein [Chloroflexota bacterium]